MHGPRDAALAYGSAAPLTQGRSALLPGAFPPSWTSAIMHRLTSVSQARQKGCHVVRLSPAAANRRTGKELLRPSHAGTNTASFATRPVWRPRPLALPDEARTLRAHRAHHHLRPQPSKPSEPVHEASPSRSTPSRTVPRLLTRGRGRELSTVRPVSRADIPPPILVFTATRARGAIRLPRPGQHCGVS